MQQSGPQTKAIDLSEARLALMRYQAAAKTWREIDPVYQQMVADREAALEALWQASSRLFGFATALGIRPRGGPGTFSL
jgi:hypothetical protein